MSSARQLELASEYDQARSRLVRIAYAVLGSNSDAEDVVSEGWLRLVQADAREPVTNVAAWSTVTVARLALDVLSSARARRERYVGPWLPEPVVTIDNDPADRVTLDESVSFALLVMLETLSPAERTSWVLHDLFQIGFPEVAQIVGRSPAAVRQLAARARQHIAAGAPRLMVTPAEHDATVNAFMTAADAGDIAGLISVLDPDVVLTSDGGGLVNAARRPVSGADKVSRFILSIAGNIAAGQRLATVLVNARSGLALFDHDRIVMAVSFTVRESKISRIDFVMAPGKLPRLT